MAPETAIEVSDQISAVSSPSEALGRRREVSPMPDPEIGNRQPARNATHSVAGGSAIENSMPGVASEAKTGDDWLPIWQIAARLNCTHRHARRELSGTDPALIRYQPQEGRGRPIKLYHVSAHPALAAYRDRKASGLSSIAACPSKTVSRLVAPDDLAIAELRAEAVRLYIELRGRLPESEAARQVCAAYLSAPKTHHIYIGERLAENKIRKHNQSVTLAGFSPGTLRNWHKAWLAGGIMGLVPDCKGKRGRKRKDIPEVLLNIVHAYSIKNPRATLTMAIAAAQKEYPGDFPDVSYNTWERRLIERDPSHFMATLGKEGISAFRAKHSPDIERDYSEMRWNELWELDDIELDFYGYDWQLLTLIRPHSYAIIRAATREWIAVVTTENEIVKAEVRELIGAALVNPDGGIPERIKFERGNVACDKDLEDLLTKIGVAVSRTSMDGGKTHPGAFADRAKGHFQGKGVIEGNIRKIHMQTWDALLQVGVEERHSAPARNATIMQELIAQAKAGMILPELTPPKWMAKAENAMLTHNSTPHPSLPRIVDAEASEKAGEIKFRHMTPAECGKMKRPAKPAIMDVRQLPMFFKEGCKLLTGKNGFTLNGFSYGRFDEGFAALAGTQVTVYASKVCPMRAYVCELGRYVDAWKAPLAGSEGDLIGRKRGIEKTKRNQFEAMVAAVGAAGSNAIIDRTRVLAGLVKNPDFEIRTVPELAAHGERMTAGEANFRTRQTRQDSRFDTTLFGGARPPGASANLNSGPSSGVRRPSSATATRRGILARGEDMVEELAVLNPSSKKEGGPLDFQVDS